MTPAPDQIQQIIDQQITQTHPYCVDVVIVLQVLSMLVTVICLPMIIWKLYFVK